MFSCFKKRLDTGSITDDTIRSMRRLRVLLKMCVDSAQHSVRILTALRDQGLLRTYRTAVSCPRSLTPAVETFLPFDLEATYCSGIILSMASFIDSTLIEDSTPSHRQINELLDEMIAHGNLVAKSRRQELEQLGAMLTAFLSQAQNQTEGSYAVVPAPSYDDLANSRTVSTEENSWLSYDESQVPTESLGQWSTQYGMDSSQLMDVAGLLGLDSFGAMFSTFNL
jgi:proline utilization trans-activator